MLHLMGLSVILLAIGLFLYLVGIPSVYLVGSTKIDRPAFKLAKRNQIRLIPLERIEKLARQFNN